MYVSRLILFFSYKNKVKERCIKLKNLETEEDKFENKLMHLPFIFPLEGNCCCILFKF